jgi:hypothetical protein
MAGAELVECSKGVRVEARDKLGDPRLDVIHRARVGQLEPVVFDLTLSETLERPLDLHAVVALVVVAADRYAPAPDPDRVSDPIEPVEHVAHVGGQCCEVVGRGVVADVRPQLLDAARVQIETLEGVRQSGNGVAVDGDGIGEPALLLVLVALLLRQAEIAPHSLHLLGEDENGAAHLSLLQVAKDVVSILDRGHAPKRRIEEPGQVVFVAAVRDRCDDLVEIQVAEEQRFVRT